MTHQELCRLTAERFVQTMAIYESTCSMREKPDVLNFTANAGTEVYEIKMSRADFLRDKEKFARGYALFGDKRYYVCYGDFIKPEELPEGWGLYWYINGKFHMKRGSSNFHFYEDDQHYARRQKCNSIILINALSYCKSNIVYSKRVLDNRIKYGIEDKEQCWDIVKPYISVKEYEGDKNPYWIFFDGFEGENILQNQEEYEILKRGLNL